ncbi:MAG: hypothetical protein NTV37_05995, partial [Proteobacteria bacterium]|nr:hypothetical protein [Pseudomonadota bacterium]
TILGGNRVLVGTLRSANITFSSIADLIKYREVFNLFRLNNAFSKGCFEFCLPEFVHVAAFISSNRIVGGKVSMRGHGTHPVVMVLVMLYNV